MLGGEDRVPLFCQAEILQATGSLGILHSPSNSRSCTYLTDLIVGLYLRQHELIRNSLALSHQRQSLFSSQQCLCSSTSAVNGMELIYDTARSHVLWTC
jgi:hypothetical protein